MLGDRATCADGGCRDDWEGFVALWAENAISNEFMGTWNEMHQRRYGTVAYRHAALENQRQEGTFRNLTMFMTGKFHRQGIELGTR